MTDRNEPQTYDFGSQGDDPFDLIRASRPSVSVDHEMIGRVGDDLKQRFGADPSRPILQAVETSDSGQSDRILPGTSTANRSSRLDGRYAYLGLVAAVILAALFVPPLVNRASGPTTDESTAIDTDGSSQEVDAAHPSSDRKREDRGDKVKQRDEQGEPTRTTRTGEDDQPERLDEPSETTGTPAVQLTDERSATTNKISKASETTTGTTTSSSTSSTSTGSTTTANPDQTATDTGDGNAPDGSSGFVANFDNNQGLDKFRVGVYHRNIGSQELGSEAEIWGDSNAFHGGQWTGDHDLNCGLPTTQRTLESRKLGGKEVEVDFALDQIVYACRGHLMTSMGDVDGYSIVWFSPKAQFARSEAKTVSWEVNVTDLKSRQWWEVSIVPTGTEFLSTTGGLAGTANIDTYHPDAVIIGNGPFGGEIRMTVDGENQYDGSKAVCGKFALDLEGCAAKEIRRTFSVADNNDGTLTIDYGGMVTQTVAGQLPDSYQVFFKDHNYTPDKDGTPVGHTWHWDAITIK